MGKEEYTRSTEEWRPVVWLIGVMLLVEGVSGALLNLTGIWWIYQDYPQQYHAPVDYEIVWTAWAVVCFLLAIGLIIAGVGLWRRARWARQTAVVLLGCQVSVIILAAFTTPTYMDDWFHGIYWKLSIIESEYWQQMLGRLQPFVLIMYIGMLLFLSLPAIRQYWGEKSHPDLPTRIAEWGRRRLLAGAPPVLLFLGLIFLCWGAGIWLNYFIELGNIWSLPHDFPQAPRSVINLLPALVYLAAGVWLLWNRRWSRQAAMAVVGVDIAYLIYVAILPIMRLPSDLSHGWPRSATYLLEPILIVLQLAILVFILLLLLKAPSPEGVEEAVPER